MKKSKQIYEKFKNLQVSSKTDLDEIYKATNKNLLNTHKKVKRRINTMAYSLAFLSITSVIGAGYIKYDNYITKKENKAIFENYKQHQSIVESYNKQNKELDDIIYDLEEQKEYLQQTYRFGIDIDKGIQQIEDNQKQRNTLIKQEEKYIESLENNPIIKGYTDKKLYSAALTLLALILGGGASLFFDTRKNNKSTMKIYEDALTHQYTTKTKSIKN